MNGFIDQVQNWYERLHLSLIILAAFSHEGFWNKKEGAGVLHYLQPSIRIPLIYQAKDSKLLDK